MEENLNEMNLEPEAQPEAQPEVKTKRRTATFWTNPGGATVVAIKRREKGMTCTEMAKALGVSQPTYSKVERANSHYRVKALMRNAIAAILECSVDELFDTDEHSICMPWCETTYGTLLLRERAASGMGIGKWAQCIGVNRMTLANIESGRASATPTMQQTISEYLKISPSELFDENGKAR